MKIKKALTKLVSVTCAMVMAVTMIPAPAAKAASSQTLESYLKSKGSSIYYASATDIKDFFKTRSNNSTFKTYIDKCKVDTGFASSYKSNTQQKKQFYDFGSKYSKRISQKLKYLESKRKKSQYYKCYERIGQVFDTLYIHSCFEQMAYGNSYDSVVNGVTDAFNRIASYTGPFEQIIKSHTLVMQAEYAMIKERIRQLNDTETYINDSVIFTPDMAAAIYMFALSLPEEETSFQLGRVVNYADADASVRMALRTVLNNNYYKGKKFVYRTITRSYAEKLYLFNLLYLDDSSTTSNAWGVLR